MLAHIGHSIERAAGRRVLRTVEELGSMMVWQRQTSVESPAESSKSDSTLGPAKSTSHSRP